MKKKANSKQTIDSDVVVGEVKQKQGLVGLASKYRINLPVAISIFLIGTAIGGLYVQKRYLAPKDSRETTATNVQNSIDEIDAKDYDTAIQQLMSARSEAATEQGRYDADVALARAYSEKGDHKRALSYYLDALRQVPDDINAILGAANAAVSAGDKKNAKEYYQKAIDYYNKQPESDSRNFIISQLQAKLDAQN